VPASRWRSNQFVLRFCLHRLDASNFSLSLQSLLRTLGNSPGSRQQSFNLGIALSTGLCIPLLVVAGGFRLLTLPTSTEELGSPCGFTYHFHGLHWGFHVSLL